MGCAHTPLPPLRTPAALRAPPYAGGGNGALRRAANDHAPTYSLRMTSASKAPKNAAPP